MVKEIAFVAYPCNDVASTRAWYEKHLGLRFSAPYSEDGVEQYNESHIGSGYFSLMTHVWMERPAGSGVGVAFEVEDIEKTISQLRAAGLDASDIYETPVCKVSSVNDPEGNKVTFHQITVPH